MGDEQLEKVQFVVKTYESNCTKSTIHALTTATAVISNIDPLVCELQRKDAAHSEFHLRRALLTLYIVIALDTTEHRKRPRRLAHEQANKGPDEPAHAHPESRFF